MPDLRAPTFAEREGVKPLPTQLELGSVSSEIRAKVWGVIYSSITANKYLQGGYSYSRNWSSVLGDMWVDLDHKYADDFEKKYIKLVNYGKGKVALPYAEFLEFIEYIVQHKHCPNNIAPQIDRIFQQCGCAYRIVDGIVVPVANPEMAQAVERAFKDLTGYLGARAHLRNAAQALSKGKYADSIRESIHAVEAVALKIAPASKTLGPALTAIEKYGKLHPALKKGISALYGYTSDEQGIRHALIEADAANAGEAEALYMLGSCASFVSYLHAAASETRG